MQKLGVFDSGIGGFNVVSKLREATSVDIVFLADHKNLPYGNKSDNIMKEILYNNMQWFVDKDIKHVLIACNTASTYIDYLRKKFPDIKIDSIIEITAKQFKEPKNLMIYGTERTVLAKTYDQHLKTNADYLALSELASLVENNNIEMIKEYLSEKLSNHNKDKDFLLACTHYSIVIDLFEDILEKKVYDSIAPTVQYYNDLTGDNKLEVYTSGNVKVLSDQLESIFDYDVKVNYKDTQYKIVLVSDNHGLQEPIEKVLKDNPDAAAFIHCGDVELDPYLVKEFYAVTGNNDYFFKYENHIVLEINELIIYITHGHEHPRHNRIKKIYEDGKAVNADIVCYGHEHIFQITKKEDMLLINPGSLFYNRDQSPNSYAIIHVNRDKLKVERINI